MTLNKEENGLEKLEMVGFWFDLYDR